MSKIIRYKLEKNNSLKSIEDMLKMLQSHTSIKEEKKGVIILTKKYNRMIVNIKNGKTTIYSSLSEASKETKINRMRIKFLCEHYEKDELNYWNIL